MLNQILDQHDVDVTVRTHRKECHCHLISQNCKQFFFSVRHYIVQFTTNKIDTLESESKKVAERERSIQALAKLHKRHAR